MKLAAECMHREPPVYSNPTLMYYRYVMASSMQLNSSTIIDTKLMQMNYALHNIDQ